MTRAEAHSQRDRNCSSFLHTYHRHLELVSTWPEVGSESKSQASGASARGTWLRTPCSAGCSSNAWNLITGRKSHQGLKMAKLWPSSRPRWATLRFHPLAFPQLGHLSHPDPAAGCVSTYSQKG